MDWLEELIKENKEMFMKDEPSEGHFERFEAKLKRERRRSKIRMIYRVTSIAAACLVMITSSIFIYDRYFDSEPAIIRLGDINPELRKVEFFYTNQIEQASVGIDALSAYSEENFNNLMAKELNDMDSIHLELQKKLGAHPGDERVINAMINYYRTRLSIMNNFIELLTQIKQSNKSTNQDYETTLL